MTRPVSHFSLWMFVSLVSFSGMHLVNVVDANAAPSPYEAEIQRPSCDPSAPEVKIIDGTDDLSALDDSNYRVFCIRPGDYTGAGDVTLTADGRKNSPRYLLYDAPNGPDPTATHPADMASNERAVLRGLVFDDADRWVVQGLFIDGGQRLSPSGDGVTFLDHSTDNVLDRVVVQHGKGTLVQIEHGSSSNVLQNSVVRETDSRASAPSKDFHCIHLKGDKPGTRDNRIVRNEIYDCAGDSIHFSGCPYWLPDAHKRSYDCSWKGEKSSRFAGDTRGTIVWGNDMYWTDDFKQVCGGGCDCYENAIDIKSTMGSTDRSSITRDDWVRIERNRIWDGCDGGASAIIAHFANSDYVLVRHNVIFNAGYAYRPVRKDDPFVDHHSVIGNVFANVQNMTSVSKIAEDIEFYNNVVVDVPGRILGGYGASNHLDFQCNAVVNGGKWAIPGSMVHSDYNDFYDTPSFGSGPNNQSHGSASDARMDQLCFDRKIWTNRHQHCLSGVRTTQSSPHRGRCPASLGSYSDVGLHDRQSSSFFRPYVDARRLNVSAEASPEAGRAPLAVSFTASASNADGTVNFSWNFDDGTQTTGANVNHTFDTAGTYDVTVEGTDASGTTDSASLRIVVRDSSDLRFAPDPYYGDFANWNPKTPVRWSITSFEGDRRLFLATSDYEADGKVPGEYALVENRNLSDFEMSFEYRTAESLQSNDFADAVVLFGWRDAQNFFFLVAHHQAQFAKLFQVDGGSRSLVTEIDRSLLPDETWHRMTLTRDGSRLRVFFDGTTVLDRTVSGLREGRVGLGAFDESVYFDDVSVITPGDGGDVGDVGDSGDAGPMSDTTGSPDSGSSDSSSNASRGCSTAGSTTPFGPLGLLGLTVAIVISLRTRGSTIDASTSSLARYSVLVLVIALLAGGCRLVQGYDADEDTGSAAADTATDASDGTDDTTGEDTASPSDDAGDADGSGELENLLKNPSFEDGPVENACPPHWTCTSYSSGGGTFSVVGDSHHLDQAAQWNRSSDPTSGAVIKQKISSQSGRQYRIDAAVKATGLDSGARIFVHVLFDTATQKARREKRFFVRGSLEEWTRVTGTTPVAPPGTEAVRFNLSMDDTAGTVSWDAASMARIDDSGNGDTGVAPDTGSDAGTRVTVGGGADYVAERRASGKPTFCTPTGTVVANQSDLFSAFKNASAGDVIYVKSGARIDLSGTEDTVIPQGVTLASDRGCNGAKGGLLFTTTRGWNLLDAESDVTLFGVRIAGPRTSWSRDSNKGAGVKLMGGDSEIVNCEIHGFSHYAIQAGDNSHIHHNHIHHNPQKGTGYGVSVSGGHPIIEYNQMNYNRHSVASGGSASYTARYNVVGPDAISHIFDQHKPGGTTTRIHHNTVRAVEQSDDPKNAPAVTIRGVPSDVASIHHNWLFNTTPPCHSDDNWPGCAILQMHVTSWQNVSFHDNHFGSSPPPSCNIGAPRAGCPSP